MNRCRASGSGSGSGRGCGSGSGKYLGMFVFLLLAALLLHTSEGRYLPTRSHGDDLDKLRELMIQILESSNEDTGKSLHTSKDAANGNVLAQHPNWFNKMNPLEALDASTRKFGVRNPYDDNGRYY